MYKCCLIGYGRAGRIHFRNIRDNANMHIKYICEIDECVKEVQDEVGENIKVCSNLAEIGEDPEITLVFVCSPTNTHYALVKEFLQYKKHVFCEKPLAESEEDIKECYQLAEENDMVLLCAYNRRFDPRIMDIKEKLGDIGKIHQVTTTSRDYPYPTFRYLKMSSGLFHDCAVHDIDYINWLLDDKPINIYVTGNIVRKYEEGAGRLDNAIIIMEYANGTIANINLSRISNNYDQIASLYGSKGVLRLTNPYEGSSSSEPISFPERYQDSYVNELSHFLAVVEKREDLKVTLFDCLNSLRIVEACEKSYASSSKITVKYADGFRNYDNVVKAIENNYHKARVNQTLAYVERMHRKYLKFDKELNVNDVFKKLEKFVDISDPDIAIPNYHHGLQTAERMREDGHPEWFQLVGLIHDLGKILYLWGSDEDGTSIDQQWGIVGDTFVVGCKLPEGIVFPEFNKENPDMQDPRYNTSLGIYEEQCGLSNVRCSWGHDEYLYRVLKHNEVNLSDEALYVIRYHSLYSYHDKGEYRCFMDGIDEERFKLLKTFNSYDLYSKSDTLVDTDQVKQYYGKLIDKYLNGGTLWF